MQSLCFHPCCFLHWAAKMNFGRFKLKCRSNDLLVEFLTLWISVVPVYITRSIRPWILKEKYHGHIPTDYSQMECCQILFSDGSVYLLPKFSIVIESLEIGVFYLLGNEDSAGQSAVTRFHVAFCPRAGERVLLSPAAVSPELLC